MIQTNGSFRALFFFCDDDDALFGGGVVVFFKKRAFVSRQNTLLRKTSS